MIERHVTSLELSKKLHEFNLKKDTLFTWEWYNDKCCMVHLTPFAVVPDQYNGCKWFNAYTASELLEIMPEIINVKLYEPHNYFRITIDKIMVYWNKVSEESYIQAYLVKYECDSASTGTKLIFPNIYHSEWDISLSDALAKMLIFLKENNLWNG